MPRPKIDAYVSELVVVIYKAGLEQLDDGPPTNRQVHAALKSVLGESCPSERWVSTRVAEYLELRTNVFNKPTVPPLGPGWPRDPKEVAYLSTLTKRNTWRGIFNEALTAEEIDVAIELREILEFKDFEGTDAPPRLQWFLPSPSGFGSEPGELGVIKEVAARRAIEEAVKVSVPYSDIYSVINFRPWTKRWVPEAATGVRLDELEKAYSQPGLCNMENLVKGLWCPPIMRMEVSGVESVRSMADFLNETWNVTWHVEGFREALVNHYNDFYVLSGKEQNPSRGTDDVIMTEKQRFRALEVRYFNASEDSQILLDAFRSLATSRPPPGEIERGYGATSIRFLDLFTGLVEDSWERVRGIHWGHIDGPLVQGYGEQPDFESWSKPEIYFAANKIIRSTDELLF